MTDLPKVELHCHIEGAAPPDLVMLQAQKYGVETTDFIQNGSYVWQDFTTFLHAYDSAAGLFRNEEDYALLAETYLSSLAECGTIYSEIFVSPDHARSAGLAPEAYIDGLCEGLSRAKKNSGIECRMIVVGIRHLGAEAVVEAANFTRKLAHPMITGFGMAGEERFGNPADYVRGFEIAKEAGLGITVHAGELSGAESVQDALDSIQPARIGHGVRAIESPELVERLADSKVVLECCPGSNVSLQVFPDFEHHPLRALKDAGVQVTLNSDDPPFFHTSLAREYEMAQTRMGFTQAEINEMTRTAIEAAFVDEDMRKKLLGEHSRLCS